MQKRNKKRLVIKHPRAEADLEDIWKYISKDNEVRADGFLEKLDENFFALAQNSGIGRRRNEFSEGIRSFAVGNYVIFYRVIDGGVAIIRVLHSARDLLSLSFNEETS